MPGAGGQSSATSASIPVVPGRAPRMLLPKWTVNHAIKLPPELLSPPGARWKDSAGAGACCVWPGALQGLSLAGAVPRAAAVPRGGQAEHPDPRFNCVQGRRAVLCVSLLHPLPFSFLVFLFNCLSTSLAPSRATVLPAALEGNRGICC